MRRISSFPCLAMRSKQRAVVAPTAPTLSDYSNLARTLAAQKESASASGSDGSTTATTRSDGEEGKAVKRRYTGKCSDGGKGSTPKEDMPPPPAPPKRKQDKAEVAEPPQKKVAKVSPNVLTDADMEKAEQFNPGSLPFSLGWHNFNKLKQFYDLDNHETTSILLAMVGPTPEGQAIWSKYKAPREYTPDPPAAGEVAGETGGGELDGEEMDDEDFEEGEGEEEEADQAEAPDPDVEVPQLSEEALAARNRANEGLPAETKKEPR